MVMVAPDLVVSVTVAFGLFLVPCAWAVVKVIKADKTASASIFFIVFFLGGLKIVIRKVQNHCCDVKHDKRQTKVQMFGVRSSGFGVRGSGLWIGVEVTGSNLLTTPNSEPRTPNSEHLFNFPGGYLV